MPKETLEKLSWLFLLLPGFLCLSVIGMIVDIGQLSEFHVTFYSLILTLVIILCALPISALVTKGLNKVRNTPVDASGATYLLFTTSTLVGIVLGVALGMAAESDRLFTALRGMPFSDSLNKRSASRPMVFLLTQNSAGRLKASGDARANKQTEAWARVNMKDGPSYEGWPEFFSIGQSPTELYLSPACRVADDKSVTKLPGPGVILVESEIRSVELLDRVASSCFALYFTAPATPTTPAAPASVARTPTK
jgi:hypothetical protein